MMECLNFVMLLYFASAELDHLYVQNAVWIPSCKLISQKVFTYFRDSSSFFKFALCSETCTIFKVHNLWVLKATIGGPMSDMGGFLVHCWTYMQSPTGVVQTRSSTDVLTAIHSHSVVLQYAS